MTVGSNIKKTRAEKDIKQADLADLLGVDISTVSRWENDKSVPNSTMIQKIAEILSVPTALLLEENETENDQQGANNLKVSKKFFHRQTSDMLFLKDGYHEVSVPNTEENRREFWNIVKHIFNSEELGIRS